MGPLLSLCECVEVCAHARHSHVRTLLDVGAAWGISEHPAQCF